jgi:stringent starvation protein B
MGPNRPYLLRAFYQWLLDNEMTPHLVVNADIPGVNVPSEHIQDGQIVLNIAPHAIGDIEMSNERVMFSARFSGKPFQLIIPMAAIIAIYARENGAGTMFEEEEFYVEQVDSMLNDIKLEHAPNNADKNDVGDDKPESRKDRSFLKVVK